VALGIIWGWHLLRRLFNGHVAWVASVLWALDPFHLANSKVLHLDATLSTLMILSALCLLIYLQDRERRIFVLSALLGGLAILTKVTALFLIPFLGLGLLTEWLTDVRDWRLAIHHLPFVVRDLFLWILVAAAICFALWPSLWVQPEATFDVVMQQGILQKMESAHGLPRFHRGALRVQDPGVGFYLDTLLFRTTFLSLPFCLLALGVAVRQRRQKQVLLVAGFAAFYVVQMTLGSRKEPRYLLPAIVALDLLSAWGIVWWTNRVGAKGAARLGLSGLLLLAQAFLVLPKHPYYGTHYNALLGGARAAQRVLPLAQFGEGLDLAGRYVGNQSGAEEAVISTQFLANEMLVQHVRAPVRDVIETEDSVDYLVFGIQYTTRGRGYPRWGALWERFYRFREPSFVAAFDGIPYAWVHVPQAEPIIPELTHVRLADSIRLVGFRLADRTLSPRDELLVTLYWRATGRVERDYTVFTHLQNEENELIAQRDGVPANGDRPTTTWEVGTVIEDRYAIPIPPEAHYGRYTLSTGMYDTRTLARLATSDDEGRRFVQDRILLTTVQVEPVVPRWRWALTGGWLIVIALGVLGSGRNPRSPTVRKPMTDDHMAADDLMEMREMC
jgi:hypothetical protein